MKALTLNFSSIDIESKDYLTPMSNLDFFIIFAVLCLIICSLLIITTMLSGRRGPEIYPELTDSDYINQFNATARANPERYPLTKKLTIQHSYNMIKQTAVPYESFSESNPDCHMSDLELVKMAAI